MTTSTTAETGRAAAATVIGHADRGCPYTSGQLARFARRRNLTRSVGRIGVRLGKRCHRIILDDTKSRVLRPTIVATRTAAKLAVGNRIE